MSKIAINICFTYKAALEKFAAIPENISSDLEYSKFQKKVKRLENILLQPTRYYKYQQLVFSLFESAPPPLCSPMYRLQSPPSRNFEEFPVPCSQHLWESRGNYSFAPGNVFFENLSPQ